jgi:hypothetical protein
VSYCSAVDEILRGLLSLAIAKRPGVDGEQGSSLAAARIPSPGEAKRKEERYGEGPVVQPKR